MRRNHTGMAIAMCVLMVFSIASLSANAGKEVVAPPAPTRAPTFAGGWPYATPPAGHFNMFAFKCSHYIVD